MIFKCTSCGKTMHWSIKSKALICDCGGTESQKVSTINKYCDNCGRKVLSKMFAQTCENCHSTVINADADKFISGIALPLFEGDEVKDKIKEFFDSYSFAPKIRSVTYKLNYLPVWLVDGKSRISYNEHKADLNFENTPIYAGNIIHREEFDALEFNCSHSEFVKFHPEYLSGSECQGLDDREEVTNDLVVKRVKDKLARIFLKNSIIVDDSAEEDKKSKKGKKNKKKKEQTVVKEIDDNLVSDFITSADIKIAFDTKMLILLPMYEAVVNEKYTYYINARSGKIYGNKQIDLLNSLSYFLLKFASAAIVLITILFIGGILLR